MTIWVIIWGLVILGAVVTDILWPRMTRHNRNGSRYIRGGRA